MIKLTREETSFVLPEGIASFPHLYAGEAVGNDNNSNMSYKMEWIGDLAESDQVMKAVSKVAETYSGSKKFQGFVTGPTGRLKKLEEMPRRDPAKYPYAVGKYVLGLTKTISPTFLGLKNPDMSDPATRAKFNQGVAEHAPGVLKFANPNNPADLAKLENMNIDRMAKGTPVIKEGDYHKTLIPVDRNEFWPGCYVRVAGYAFWSENTPLGKTVLLGLNHVLMTRQGDRLVGETTPDDSFAAFAPSADLAPNGEAKAAPVANGKTWADLT